MSYLDKPIDLEHLDGELVNSASSLKTLSYLLMCSAPQIGALPEGGSEELVNGMADLIGMVASRMYNASSDFSDLRDQLTFERPCPGAHQRASLHLVRGRHHDN